MNTPPVDIVDRHHVKVVEVLGDTCDACPAIAKVQAYVYAELTTGSVSYCAHHGTLFLPGLKAIALVLIDRRDELERD
jgi:hypothetical protein